MLRRTVRSEFGEVSLRETGILHARVFTGMEIDLKRAKDYHALVSYLSRQKHHVTVIDITGISSVTPGARTYLQEASSEWKKTLAVALVTNTFTARVIGNFFLSVNRPSYPIQVFTESLVAHQWVKNEYLRAITSKAS